MMLIDRVGFDRYGYKELCSSEVQVELQLRISCRNAQVLCWCVRKAPGESLAFRAKVPNSLHYNVLVTPIEFYICHNNVITLYIRIYRPIHLIKW